MFPESFAFQLLAFALAQAAAWANMLTGRFALGFFELAVSFVLADLLIVMRLVGGDFGAGYQAWLVVFQLACAAAAAEWALRRLYCRRPAFRARQATAYGAGLDAWIEGREDEALQCFRRLFRKDPWDGESACMIATVLASLGRRRAATWWYRRAKARVARPLWKLEIDEEIRCLRATGNALATWAPPGADAKSRETTPRPARRHPAARSRPPDGKAKRNRAAV